MATLGYVRSSNGPDLAQVGVNEQLVSHVIPNTSGASLKLTHVSGWVGNWFAQATIRFGVWAVSSSTAAPGALLARTVEGAPTVNYVDGAGGQLITLALETPYDLAPGQMIALGIASRGNPAGIAMFQASGISQPNENFYRKNISGTTLQSGSGSAATNEGQLAIYVTGDTNQTPGSPSGLYPWGTIKGSLKPTFQFLHNDPDNDNPSRYQIQGRRGGTVIWDKDGPYGGGVASVGYDGPALNYYETLEWRVRTRDSSGAWGPYSSWAWVVIEHTNRRPGTPIPLTWSVVPGVNRTAKVEMKFSDPDYPTLPNGQQWERFESKQIKITRKADNALIWDSGVIATTSGEKSGLKSITNRNLPQFDVTYVWAERHFDRSGEGSSYRYVEVIARSGVSVGQPTSPTGRVTNPWSPGAIASVYDNTVGAPAQMFRVQLHWESNGSMYVTSKWVTKAVSPGDAFTIPWADLEIGGLPASDFTVHIQARDTLSNLSQFSEGSIISVNRSPNTPINHSPPDGFVASYLGHLRVNATDPDQPRSELAVTIELFEDDGTTLIGTIDAPYDPAINGHRVVPSSLITGYKTFKWRAYSFDGATVGYSGGSQTAAGASRSPLYTYVYAAVPSVTITSPAGPTITTSQPVLSWSTAGQTHWRVRGYNVNGQVAYDTGERVGTGNSIAIQANQYWIDGERWNNNETFTWEVLVRDSSTLWGTSPQLELKLEYVPPAPLNIELAEARSLPGVRGTHYGHFEHSQSEYPEGEFLSYTTDRVEIDGPGGIARDDTMIPGYVVNGASGDPTVTDFDMTSNQWYRYGTRQVIQSGVDVIESEPVYVELMVSWLGTLLHMPFDPLNAYVWLNYGSDGGSYEPVRRRQANNRMVMPINGSEPIGYGSRQRNINVSGEYTFITNDLMTAIQQLDTLDRIFDYQNPSFSPDGRPHDICWREGRGGRSGRLYVQIESMEDAPSVGHTQGVSLGFVQVKHRVGSEVAS